MDNAERERRREEFSKEIRDRQKVDGHESPFPSFLNVVTDYIIDFEDRLKKLEDRAKSQANLANEVADLRSLHTPLG